LPVWAVVFFTEVIFEERVETAFCIHTKALHQRVLPCRAHCGSVDVEVELRYRRAVVGGTTITATAPLRVMGTCAMHAAFWRRGFLIPQESAGALSA
jgi:hypothetical protein